MKLILTILSGLIFLNSFCQEKDYKSLTFANTAIKLHQENPGEIQYLIVKDLNNNVLNKITLEKEYDPYHVETWYSGERNFVLIGGRYKFFIFNINNKRIIGPFSATQRGKTQDGQSGVLYAYKIIDDGQYLLVNALDFGLFCYSLQDLNNPKTLQYFKSDSTFFKGKYTFLDLREKNIYNMISASCGNYIKDIDSDILFKGYRLQQDNNLNVIYCKTSNKCLIFNHIENDDDSSKLIVDLETGVLVNRNSDKELDIKIQKE